MKIYKRRFKESMTYDKASLLYKETPLYKSGIFLIDVILNIREVYRKYERSNETKLLLQLKKYTGLTDILFNSKQKVYYRGLFLKKEDGYKHSADFESIVKTKKFKAKNQYSWTTNIEQAKTFAMGSTHWMDKPKLNDDYYKGRYFGIILEYAPTENEILIDMNYMENEYDKPLFSSGFGEDEVIIFPKSSTLKVKEILV